MAKAFATLVENLVGISAPKKEYLAPPPKFPADTLPAPSPPPLFWRTPPPLVGFSKKKPTPGPPSLSPGFPLPLPRAEKNKKYPTCPPRKCGGFFVRFLVATFPGN